MLFGIGFHVVVAYFLSIAVETDRPMNSKIQPAHLIYSNSHQHSLKHDLNILTQCNMVPEGKSSGFGLVLNLKLLEIKSKF